MLRFKRHPAAISFMRGLACKPFLLSSALKRFHQNKLNAMLTRAMEAFDYPTFKLALCLGADPNIDTHIQKGYPLVTRCARCGEAIFLDTLIKFGGDVHARLPLGSHLPLHMAASKGMEETIEVLARHGADIHAVYAVDGPGDAGAEPGGWTPLICACVHNKTQAAIKLLELGANPWDANEKNQSALDLCLKAGNGELAQRILLKQGALRAGEGGGAAGAGAAHDAAKPP